MVKYVCLVLSLFLFSSCEISEVFTKPTAREVYEQSILKEDKLVWNTMAEYAFYDSTIVESPYSEFIKVDSNSGHSFGMRIKCELGEVLHVDVSAEDVLIDIFRITSDSVDRFEPVLQPFALSTEYKIDIKRTASYLVRIQSKLQTEENIGLHIYTQPIYKFPVAGGENRDIGSFWGDPRDGGKRKHKGIDIFAKKGTPLLAVTDGRVRTVRNRGRGGKQVWINDQPTKYSIYYAHLDSQYVKPGQLIQKGDTIGTVGNSGNARTTPPHLHFAIYIPYEGAIDPLAFVKKQSVEIDIDKIPDLSHVNVTAQVVSMTSLRTSPFGKASKLGVLARNESVTIIGVSGDWYHVRDKTLRAGFVKTSLLKHHFSS